MSATPASSWRLLLVYAFLGGLVVILAGRLIQLHLVDSDFLQQQGDIRSLRIEALPAYRGTITDRNQQPLAISSPVATLWANPQVLSTDPQELNSLALALNEEPKLFARRLAGYANREFMYLKRQVTPDQAEKILALGIKGVFARDEYKRYYPAGEVAAHLVGFTNVDEQGQEGLELAWQSWLEATAGRKRILKDLKGRAVRNLAVVEAPQPGQDLTLSLDLRLQHLAYVELKAAVEQHKAISGSMILLDANKGEVLAMVNAPAFNPNNRSNFDAASLRNRALTDLFEPGSVIKPLSVAVALQSGQFTPTSIIDTAPGRLRLAGQTIRDARNYGELTPEQILVHSSNVGMARMILELPDTMLVDYYADLGFGRPTGTGFPGEAAGVLPGSFGISRIKRATLSYGYGLSMTLGQLAQAYMVLADQGRLHPLSLLKVNQPSTQQIFEPHIANQILAMLEKVVQPGGTGRRAAIQGYRVAGKTGTVHKLSRQDGYESGDYLATFAGIAPVSNPRLVAVIVIDSPKGQEYFGGEVAAPVFSRVVGQALRILNVPPDNPEQLSQEVNLP